MVARVVHSLPRCLHCLLHMLQHIGGLFVLASCQVQHDLSYVIFIAGVRL